MNNVIKNGRFEHQLFTPWHSSAYPAYPVMPHYQGSQFSVLINTGDHIQQNIAVRRDIPFTARWAFMARLISDSGDQGARILTGLFAAADHEARATTITDRNWQTYTHTDDQIVHSKDGYLGIVFSDPFGMPDPGIRTTVQVTGIELWIDYVTAP